MKYVDLTNVQEAGSYKRIKPGGYICRIQKVTDVFDKEYLKIEFDIADGEFKGYYRDLYNRFGNWTGNYCQSYGNNSLPFFKALITAIEKSNNGYKFDFNEHTLAGKYVGFVFGEEEYINPSGEVKTRVKPTLARSVEAIRNKDFSVPELKRLESPQTGYGGDGFVPVDDDGYPWEQ